MVIPFETTHLRLMKVQASQQAVLQHVTDNFLSLLENTNAFTAVIDGEIVACAGVIEYYKGRGEAWSYLSADLGRNMVSVFRAIKSYLDTIDVRRIEMTVDTDFAEGHRFAKLLGFELEASRMKAYDMDGRDKALYARIKNV